MSEPEVSLHQQEIELSPVKSYFGYEGKDRDDDFEFIAGWAQERGFKTPEDMHVEMRQIEQRLGTGHISEDRINRFKNYVKARARLDSAWKEIMSMEQHG